MVALFVLWVGGASQNRSVRFNACRACTNADARRRPKDTGEILCLQHSDFWRGGENESAVLPTCAEMERMKY